MSVFRRHAGVSWLDYLLIRAARTSRWGLFLRGQINAPRSCVFIWTHIILLPFLFGRAYIITSEGVCFQSVMRVFCHQHYLIHTHTRRYVTTVMDITTFVIITQLTKVLYIYIKKRSRGRTQRRGEEFRASHGRDLMRAPSPGGSA